MLLFIDYILAFHLVKDRHNHIEGRSLARILIHANSNELCKMRRNARRNADAQIFQSDLK